MGEVIQFHIQPNAKQLEFFEANTKFICYGGARGGGKSWAMRRKAELLAIQNPGIQILLLRRTLNELRENHVIPMLKELKGIAKYREQSKSFIFSNESRIVLGYCDNERDVLQYQGQAYDVICLEEATQFTEFQFQTLTESLRPSGNMQVKFNPRMYLTCNPGGVGHEWVKRLFIDRIYRFKEKPEDYTFIKALVYDNKYLMENDPTYIETLENLPEDRRKAMLLGDWDVFEGQFFREFNRDVHVIEPFEIPKGWFRYRAMDYGLDMLAVVNIAVDYRGNCYVYNEIHIPNLIVSEAVKKILEQNDDVILTYAPPDMWNRRQETGKSVADIFNENGLPLVKASNDRQAGWLAVKEIMKVFKDEQEIDNSKLKIFRNCVNLIANISKAQFSERDPNDMATQPHEHTHILDALRYFSVMRNVLPQVVNVHKVNKETTFDWEEPLDEDKELEEFNNWGCECG